MRGIWLLGSEGATEVTQLGGRSACTTPIMHACVFVDSFYGMEWNSMEDFFS